MASYRSFPVVALLALSLVLLVGSAHAADNISLRHSAPVAPDISLRTRPSGAVAPGISLRTSVTLTPETVRRRRADTWLDAILPPEKDAGLFMAAQLSLLLDMGQTLDIRHHPNKFEANSILGPHPHDDRVRLYFGSIMVSTALAWWALPPRWSNALSRVVLAVQLPVVHHNNRRDGVAVRLGVRF